MFGSAPFIELGKQILIPAVICHGVLYTTYSVLCTSLAIRCFFHLRAKLIFLHYTTRYHHDRSVAVFFNSSSLLEKSWLTDFIPSFPSPSFCSLPDRTRFITVIHLVFVDFFTPYLGVTLNSPLCVRHYFGPLFEHYSSSCCGCILRLIPIQRLDCRNRFSLSTY
jgi:hypothetical protein